MADDIDGFLTRPQICRLEGGICSRALANRIEAGTFPKHDAIVGGALLWLTSTYKAHQAKVLAGEYRGRDRLAAARRRNTEAP
jgi:hypothetical protein